MPQGETQPSEVIPKNQTTGLYPTLQAEVYWMVDADSASENGPGADAACGSISGARCLPTRTLTKQLTSDAPADYCRPWPHAPPKYLMLGGFEPEDRLIHQCRAQLGSLATLSMYLRALHSWTIRHHRAGELGNLRTAGRTCPIHSSRAQRTWQKPSQEKEESNSGEGSLDTS